LSETCSSLNIEKLDILKNLDLPSQTKSAEDVKKIENKLERKALELNNKLPHLKNSITMGSEKFKASYEEILDVKINFEGDETLSVTKGSKKLKIDTEDDIQRQFRRFILS
jgi:hypothetical protein